MDPNHPASIAELIKVLFARLRNQLLLFALATILALAFWGGGITQAFIPLVYILVVGALIVYSFPRVLLALREYRRDTSKPGLPPGGPPPPFDNPGSAPPPLPAPPDVPSESEQLAMYLDRVKSENNVLRLGGISSEASDPQKRLKETRNPHTLTDVFIPLRIDRYRLDPEEARKVAASRSSGHKDDSILEGTRLSRTNKQLTALEGLGGANEQRAVLLGQPGSGKSSVLRFLAYRLAEAYLQPALLSETLPEWAAGNLLPVFVPLARLADTLPDQPGAEPVSDLVVSFIQKEVEAEAEMRGFARRLWRETRERGVLFLFDGLDEVAVKKRAVLKDALAGFMASRGQCRAVVTCRTFSYGDEHWQLPGWPAYQLEPLSPDEQRTFIRKWYNSLIRSDPLSQELYTKKASLLEENIFSGDSRQLQQISGNPLLLTLIAIVHTHQEELPRSRVRIYEECVKLLLLRWQTRRQPNAPLRSIVEAMAEAAPDRRDGLESQLMRGLYDLAFRVREGRGMREGETTLIDLHSLQAALQPKLGQAATEVFVEYCQSANGLLLAQGSRRLPERPADEEPVPCFALPHPSFEEYLAARYIATLDNPGATLAARNALNDRWFFVGLFLAEYGAYVNQRPRDVLDLVDELMAGAEPPWRNVWLAGVIWSIFFAQFPDRREANSAREGQIRERLKVLCATGQLSPIERADAGRALSVLGDPRDLEELVVVPAGKFRMGSDRSLDAEAYDNEEPSHEIHLPEFKIGKYPVTVALWKRFVAATGYDCGRNSLRGPDNHPAHDVSWYDARACCTWLTAEWRRAGHIGAEEVVRLPTEAEWEKAARGDDRRAWSWGNTFSGDEANTNEAGIRRACAVGLFPRGASFYECLDMSGNVWEWTSTLFKPYPYQASDGREGPTGGGDRVLRGGSFNYSRGLARCAFRNINHPDGRFDNIGFRVVVSPGWRESPEMRLGPQA